MTVSEGEARDIVLREWIREGLVLDQCYIIGGRGSGYREKEYRYFVGKHTFVENRRSGPISEQTFAKIALAVRSGVGSSKWWL